jgi:hypothetical protein
MGARDSLTSARIARCSAGEKDDSGLAAEDRRPAMIASPTAGARLAALVRVSRTRGAIAATAARLGAAVPVLHRAVVPKLAPLTHAGIVRLGIYSPAASYRPAST